MRPRRARRKRRIFLHITTYLLIVLAVLAVLFLLERDPQPARLIMVGEQYLNFAREARADLDAPATFEEAGRMLAAARTTMREQFRRPAFLRNYDDARDLLGRAQRLIAQSIEEARATVADRERRLREEIRQVRREAEEVRALLQNLPPEHQLGLAHIVSAESRIVGAQTKLTSQESRDALESMRLARAEVSLALRDVRGLLLEFLDRRSEWRRDIEQTLAWTREPGRVALIVDKLNHELHVIHSGRRVQTYPAELGPGWLVRKIREGDKATPEGRYRVIRKKAGSQTRYHKALLLDYPNDSDSLRFRRMMEDGLVPRYARIGGLIEIHGSGGKGEDWTMGCVSLQNEHIDEIFPQLAVGSPVTIVGLWNEPSWLTRLLETASR